MEENPEDTKEAKRVAYIVIIAFGLISLFGDIIYEGAKGIIPTYLCTLGATATIVGLATGFGDFIGYALRIISGYVADVKRIYWFFVFLGYGLLVSIPLLALVGHWEIAVILVIIERMAKAFRSPARDTLISVTTQSLGTGKAFGFHELLDQLGAVSGPALLAVILYTTNNNYFYAFSSLFIPYIFLIIILLIVFIKVKPYTDIALAKISKGSERSHTDNKLPREFYLYSLAVFLNTAGLITAQLIQYIAGFVMAIWMVSLVYLMVQGIDAFFAPVSGYIYDKIGRYLLIVPFALSVLPSLFALQGTYFNVIIAAIFAGIILGMQESIYRAAVSDITSIDRRGTAYGLFYVFYGLGFVVSGFMYGMFIDLNLYSQAIIYAVILQILAILLLLASNPRK